MRYGQRQGVPSWVTSLVLAEKWNVPPWVVHEHEGGQEWAARQSALEEARERSRKMDAK